MECGRGLLLSLALHKQAVQLQSGKVCAPPTTAVLGWAEDPQRPGLGDGLGAVSDSQLAIDVARVLLDGGQRHVELPGDLLVRHALGDKLEHLQLALAQRLYELADSP